MQQAVTPRRTVYAGKRLIQQQQLRTTHPGAGEKHSAHLSVRELDERPGGRCDRSKKASARFAAALSASVGWIVEPDARMSTRLHHLGDGELLRVIGLQ